MFQFGVMNGVAGSAGNTIFIMGRTHEFALRRIGLVTGQTTLGYCLRFRSFKYEYLALVASAGDVGRTRAVARLAPMNLLAPYLGQVGSVMRAPIDVLKLILVAALAGVSAYVCRAAGWIGVVVRRLRR
jgi:hypothetical protein